MNAGLAVARRSGVPLPALLRGGVQPITPLTLARVTSLSS